jgi:hypothetical protein
MRLRIAWERKAYRLSACLTLIVTVTVSFSIGYTTLSLLRPTYRQSTHLSYYYEENRYFGLCDMKKSLFRPNLKISKYF